jgi:hypothetical protein
LFVAHLPAGYLLSRQLTRHPKLQSWLWLGLLGSVLPDFDLAWFYLVDGRQHLHHSYWTHLPIYWLAIAAGWLLLAALLRAKRLVRAGLVLFPNVFLHLALDTVAGKIRWLHPWSSESFALFDVPARYGSWIENFLRHWTFGIEVGLVALALVVFLRSRARGPTSAQSTGSGDAPRPTSAVERSSPLRPPMPR